MNITDFKRGDLVEKVGGRYGGPGRIVGDTDELDANGYKLYAVAHKIEGGYGEFVHVFPASALEARPERTPMDVPMLAVAPSPAKAERDAPDIMLGEMPSYGLAKPADLIAAVAEAIYGDRAVHLQEIDDSRFLGHQMVPAINFNSLNRIVSAFCDGSALATPTADKAREELELENAHLRRNLVQAEGALIAAEQEARAKQ